MLLKIDVGGEGEFHSAISSKMAGMVSPSQHLGFIKRYSRSRNSTVTELSTHEMRRVLMAAASSGDTALVCEILQAGHINVSCRDSIDMSTPLHHAASRGHTTVMQALLLHETCKTAVCDENGKTPLHAAAEKGHVEAIRCLLNFDQGLAKMRDKNGFTALHLAAKHNFADAALLLIELGQSNINCKTVSQGTTPGHLACENNSIAVLQLLISKGANLRTSDLCGETPLDKALHQGHTRITMLLLQCGVETIESEDRYGQTILHRACRHANKELVYYMFQYFPHQTLSVLNTRERILGFTPLHLCCLNQNERGSKSYEMNTYYIALALLRHHARADARVRFSGDTALHISLRKNRPDLAKLLVSVDRSLLRKKNYDEVDPRSLLDSLNMCL